MSTTQAFANPGDHHHSNGNNGFFDLIKAQLLMRNFAGIGSNSGSDMNPIWTLVIVSFLQFLLSLANQLMVIAKAAFDRWWNARIVKAMEKVVTHQVKEGDPACLLYERYWDPKLGIPNETFVEADAIIRSVSMHPRAKEILTVGNLSTVSDTSPIEISPGLCFTMTYLGRESASFSSIKFKLTSKTLTVRDMQFAVEKLKEEYLREKNNSLGSHLYYFDQFNGLSSENKAELLRNGQVKLPAPSFLRFTKHKFETNRKLSNIFFDGKDTVEHRFRFFLENKAWYDERGIPYTLGMLLHGTPGTGKTSTIKAIANESRRHIMNINIGRLRSKRLLKKLFYDPIVEIIEPGMSNQQPQSFYIPIEKRVYVIEDADSLLGDIFSERSSPVHAPNPNPTPNPNPDSPDPGIIRSVTRVGSKQRKPQSYAEMADVMKENDDDLDLATVLNILDGTLETPGRILILTSNYPEKFDSALIRPGRIDMICRYGKCSHDMILSMYKCYYSDDIGLQMSDHELRELVDAIEPGKWSPAEVTQVLMINFQHRKQALIQLESSTPEEVFYKFKNTGK